MTDDLTPAERQARSLADLLSILELRELGTGRITVTGVDDVSVGVGTPHIDVYEGDSLKQPHNRVYGGQVLAQSLTAANLTIRDEHPGRLPHSLHAYFLRPGDDTLPIRFSVERMRDGRSFSARRVHALQHDRTILSLTVSYQDPAGGLDHHDEMPEVPAPEDLAPVAEKFATIDHPRALHLVGRPVDHRYVEGDITLQVDSAHAARQDVWFRLLGEVGPDPYRQASVLAYMSDYTLLESVLRRHGRSWMDPSLRVASLDHSMWFHRIVDPSQWLLYSQDSPSAQGGRGLGVGKVFTRDGVLTTTIAQEGMVRVKGG
ncbi:acyl-CoA thioesterase II [Janibacter sp. DB-40]|uniref:acyl-CoA thioesterase n=1 Tax=Janibacter sp. DB-40 TaxID=3028808 RepID=UPI002404D9C4|nr:acyl-CoA thioesterase II [Janibacter sp. DB-40]